MAQPPTLGGSVWLTALAVARIPRALVSSPRSTFDSAALLFRPIPVAVAELARYRFL